MQDVLLWGVGVIVLFAGGLGAYLFLKGQRFDLVEYERIAVFKGTGEFVGIRGPGRVFIWPSIFRFWVGEQVRGSDGLVVKNADVENPESRFDLREETTPIVPVHCITGDDVVVSISPAFTYRITDPEKLVLNINDHGMALANAIHGVLFAVVGGMSLTEVITGREFIVEQMRARISEQAERWGINVISVELTDVKPDEAVEKAMNDRKAAEEKAEADRLNLVVAAEARRQGGEIDNQTALAKAEADKQSIIAMAEAEKYAAIAKAEGDKEAEILKAQGTNALYRAILELGDEVDVVLKYEQIQALRSLGNSSNSKLVILPANMTDITGLRDISMVDGNIASQ